MIFLDHGHTHSANYDIVFQWFLCYSALKSSSGGGFEAHESI